MKRFVFVLAILLSFASSVYSQTLDTTRVNTTFGYDVYRSGVLIERHTTTPTGETVSRYVAGPGGTCSSGAVVSINANGIPTCSAAPPLVNPIFTGQWTVNGSLCAAGQVVQGGSPTTCSGSPTLLQLTMKNLKGIDAAATYQAFTFDGDVGQFGRWSELSSTKGGAILTSYATDHTNPTLRIHGVANGGYGNTHVPFTVLQQTYWFGGSDLTSKFLSVCKYEGSNPYCDAFGSGLTLVGNGPYPATTNDGTFDLFGSGAAVIRVKGSGGDADLGTTETPGLVLQNPIATRSGGASTVEYSPSLDFQGSAWNSTGAASQLDTWSLINRPATVAGTTTSMFALRSSINNGSFSDMLTVRSNGATTASGTICATNDTSLTCDPLGWGSRLRFSGIANGNTIGQPVISLVDRETDAELAEIGRIDFGATAQSGAGGELAMIRAFTRGATAGNRGGQLRITLKANGSSTQNDLLDIDGGAGDTPFRFFNPNSINPMADFAGNLNLSNSGALQLGGNTMTAGTTWKTAGGSGMAVANVGANSCGTTTATIAGNNNAGEVTVGATSGTQCRIAFTVTAATKWQCTASDESTAVLTRGVPVDTTHADLVGVFTAGDVITYICFPR